MIPKIYKRKAINVAAIQVTRENAKEVVEWLKDNEFHAEVLWDKNKVYWQSRDKNLTVRFGDWIIRSGSAGLFHPCRDQYFQNTYEDYNANNN